MGVYQAYGPCYICRRPFFFHPHRVPSVRVNGVREPICEACMARVNADRQAAGRTTFDVLPGAYGAADEHEMDEEDFE